VAYDGPQRPGTIVIDTPNKFLYLVQPSGRVVRYGIGVGRPGFMWSGLKQVSRKAEWPGWTPPPEMLRRRPNLPRHMEGGPANPLGARALISALRSTASTAPTSRTRSARTSHPAASA
jgi:lipoprotein-anchoring transpeptidase ErfK/SrfK